MPEPGPDTAVSSLLYRVEVRILLFEHDTLALWFAQAEAQFVLAGVMIHKTKFNQVVYKLQQPHAEEV
jgi:hypothetical protein